MATQYTPLATGATPTLGTSGDAVSAYQTQLNTQNQGKAGYKPLTVDGKYGPLTQAASQYKAPVETPKTDATVPRVTPPTTTTPTATTATQQKSAAESYLSTFTPPPTEDQNYQTLLGQTSGLINAINAGYNDELKSANAASAARVNAGGLSGSSAGGQVYTEAQQPIIDKRNKALEEVYSNIHTNAQNLTMAEKAQATTDATNAIALQDKARATAGESIKALAANHLDWNAYKTTNPDNYQSLVTALGGDPNVADAMFAMSAPPENVVNSYYSSDGQGGTTVNQVLQDPVTGKISHTTYTIPGFEVPKNWNAEKIGTNAQIYKSQDFNPSDPSTYMIVSTDPTNGGAVTVTQNGKTTINGVPVTDTPGVSGTNATVGAAPNVASIIGLTDPSMPLSAVIADPSIGIEGIIAGIMKNEGGSPKGVVNNPGNIKFVGQAGAKDSGIKATDGGTFASYDTPQAGKQAIAGLINKGAASGKNFDDFINAYTGTSGSPTSPNGGSGSILSATGISLPVFNYLTQGTASMSRMSAADRKKITAQASDFLNKNGVDVSTFQAEYKAYNDVLNQNIQRNAKTKIMENELVGTVDNLLKVVNEKDLSDINVQNVADVWAGKQVNDPLATQYAFHFEQLKNELAGYFAASQGKSSPDVIDNEDAAGALIQGMSTGSLTGFRNSVENSTGKMSGVLKRSVDDAQKNVWSLFGVGDKFKPKDDISQMAQAKGLDYQAAKSAGYSDEQIQSYLSGDTSKDTVDRENLPQSVKDLLEQNNYDVNNLTDEQLQRLIKLSS